MNRIENEIINSGYYIKNSFICAPDEYFSYNLRKIKSLNDLNLEIKNSKIINQDDNNYIKYYNIIFDKLKNKIMELINNKIDNWLENIIFDYNNKKTIYKNNIIHINEEYELLKSISYIFINKNTYKKNIISLIRDLKDKISESNINNSSNSIEFIKWLDLQINILSINKNVEKKNIKDKISEQFKINKILNIVNNSCLEPYIEDCLLQKNNITRDLDILNKNHKDLFNIIKNQVNNLLEKYNKIILDFTKKNINKINLHNNIIFDFEDKLIIGNNLFGKNKVEINFTTIIDFDNNCK